MKRKIIAKNSLENQSYAILQNALDIQTYESQGFLISFIHQILENGILACTSILQDSQITPYTNACKTYLSDQKAFIGTTIPDNCYTTYYKSHKAAFFIIETAAKLYFNRPDISFFLLQGFKNVTPEEIPSQIQLDCRILQIKSIIQALAEHKKLDYMYNKIFDPRTQTSNIMLGLFSECTPYLDALEPHCCEHKNTIYTCVLGELGGLYEKLKNPQSSQTKNQITPFIKDIVKQLQKNEGRSADLDCLGLIGFTNKLMVIENITNMVKAFSSNTILNQPPNLSQTQQSISNLSTKISLVMPFINEIKEATEECKDLSPLLSATMYHLVNYALYTLSLTYGHALIENPYLTFAIAKGLMKSFVPSEDLEQNFEGSKLSTAINTALEQKMDKTKIKETLRTNYYLFNQDSKNPLILPALHYMLKHAFIKKILEKNNKKTTVNFNELHNEINTITDKDIHKFELALGYVSLLNCYEGDEKVIQIIHCLSNFLNTKQHHRDYQQIVNAYPNNPVSNYTPRDLGLSEPEQKKNSKKIKTPTSSSTPQSVPPATMVKTTALMHPVATLPKNNEKQPLENAKEIRSLFEQFLNQEIRLKDIRTSENFPRLSTHFFQNIEIPNRIAPQLIQHEDYHALGQYLSDHLTYIMSLPASIKNILCAYPIPMMHHQDNSIALNFAQLNAQQIRELKTIFPEAMQKLTKKTPELHALNKQISKLDQNTPVL